MAPANTIPTNTMSNAATAAQFQHDQIMQNSQHIPPQIQLVLKYRAQLPSPLHLNVAVLYHQKDNQSFFAKVESADRQQTGKLEVLDELLEADRKTNTRIFELARPLFWSTDWQSSIILDLRTSPYIHTTVPASFEDSLQGYRVSDFFYAFTLKIEVEVPFLLIDGTDHTNHRYGLIKMIVQRVDRSSAWVVSSIDPYVQAEARKMEAGGMFFQMGRLLQRLGEVSVQFLPLGHLTATALGLFQLKICSTEIEVEEGASKWYVPKLGHTMKIHEQHLFEREQDKRAEKQRVLDDARFSMG